MRLRALREAKSLSQEAVAKKAQISREYLSRLEAGRYDPTLGVLQRLAKALGVSLMELLGERGATAVAIERLKRTLSNDMRTLSEGKGVLGINEMADELQKLGPEYRFLAREIRSAKNHPDRLATAYTIAIAKLERTHP